MYTVDKEWKKNPNLETEFFDFNGVEVMEDWWDWGEDVKWGHGYRMFWNQHFVKHFENTQAKRGIL